MAESFTNAEAETEEKTISGVLNRQLKFSLNLWAAFAMLLLATGLAQPQTAQSPLPQPTGYVNDYAGVVDSATKQQLETTLGKLDRQQQIQFAVVTVDTT